MSKTPAANFARMTVNVVFGLGGLLDVATDAGIPRAKTDFGETLHVWGAGEGHYVERPFWRPLDHARFRSVQLWIW